MNEDEGEGRKAKRQATFEVLLLNLDSDLILKLQSQDVKINSKQYKKQHTAILTRKLNDVEIVFYFFFPFQYFFIFSLNLEIESSFISSRSIFPPINHQKLYFITENTLSTSKHSTKRWNRKQSQTEEVVVKRFGFTCWTCFEWSDSTGSERYSSTLLLDY